MLIKLNDERIVKKLQDDYSYSRGEACETLKEIKDVVPELYPLVEAWLNGEFLDYKLKDISISYMMKEKNFAYLMAITWMDALIKHPELIDSFKRMSFQRR